MSCTTTSRLYWHDSRSALCACSQLRQVVKQAAYILKRPPPKVFLIFLLIVLNGITGKIYSAPIAELTTEKTHWNCFRYQLHSSIITYLWCRSKIKRIFREEYLIEEQARQTCIIAWLNKPSDILERIWKLTLPLPALSPKMVMRSLSPPKAMFYQNSKIL